MVTGCPHQDSLQTQPGPEQSFPERVRQELEEQGGSSLEPSENTWSLKLGDGWFLGSNIISGTVVW